MPAHDGVGLDEHQRGAPMPPCCRERDPEQPIPSPDARSSVGAFHRDELLPQREVFKHQFVMSTATQRQAADEHKNQPNTRPILVSPDILNQPAPGAF